MCEIQAVLTPINTNVSTTAVPLLGPNTGGEFSPFDTGISLWSNDTIQSVTVGGQYSNEAGSSAFGGGLCIGNINNVDGLLYGLTPGMKTPFLIEDSSQVAVSSDGDLFVGLNATSSAVACWENIGLSVQTLRCVDNSGNTYPCDTTTSTETLVNTGTRPLTYSFSVNGPGGITPSYTTGSSTLIVTDNLLQVEVEAGAASEVAIPGYSAFTASYNCVSYTVTLYDQNGNALQSQQTGTLAVSPGTSGLCPSAQNSVTLDFSSAVSNGTHGGVSIGVVADQYDFYCQMWWSYYYEGSTQFYDDYSYMCPMHGVYSNYTVTGTLLVQTN